MAKLSNEELLAAFKDMTLIELSEFVKLFEDTFGVTAAAPVAVAAAPAAGAAPVEEVEEKSDFDVILESGGDKKIQAIKEVRKLVTTLSLADAKALVDEAPKTVLEKVNKETAEKAKEALEAVGATVTIK
jgi:large subunit ribosomal protein L7/L12